MLSMSDALVIGFYYKAGEIPCLMVTRQTNQKLTILNTLYGDEAFRVYNQLVNASLKQVAEQVLEQMKGEGWIHDTDKEESKRG